MSTQEPTVLISDSPAQASPKTYSIPASLSFVPTAVTARFDGTGSGSNFLPCLTFKSSTGLILARQFPSEVAAAGGDYEVSFAPF